MNYELQCLDVDFALGAVPELRQAFSDEEHFAAAVYRIHSEPSMGKTMQTMMGEQHRINRTLVSRPFFPRPVRDLIEFLIEPQAHLLLDKVESQSDVDMVVDFARACAVKTRDWVEWILKPGNGCCLE